MNRSKYVPEQMYWEESENSSCFMSFSFISHSPEEMDELFFLLGVSGSGLALWGGAAGILSE